tara:strand:- start:452 stop:679 length:228 start_codon:yes stop_codon:yes gene_type:complete
VQQHTLAVVEVVVQLVDLELLLLDQVELAVVELVELVKMQEQLEPQTLVVVAVEQVIDTLQGLFFLVEMVVQVLL